jgi:outer membrane biogenesis lipoprotein LolB
MLTRRCIIALAAAILVLAGCATATLKNEGVRPPPDFAKAKWAEIQQKNREAAEFSAFPRNLKEGRTCILTLRTEETQPIWTSY